MLYSKRGRWCYRDPKTGKLHKAFTVEELEERLNMSFPRSVEEESVEDLPETVQQDSWLDD